MNRLKGRSKLFLIISLCMMLISMLGASLIQTSGGRVNITELTFETDLGLTMSGRLFVPDGVTLENPAPAIVVSHGMFNNNGMQDLNFVELSRRGFVVFAMDMFSHGNSERVEATPVILQSMDQAVQMIARIGYVDSSRIGVSGHSLGAMSSNIAVTIDNVREVPLISAVLLNSADAVYGTEEGFLNIYGSRHVGIVAPMHEEFFMLDVDEYGYVTPPREFIYHHNAQSFLHFGEDPAELALPQREAGTFYRSNFDGEEAIRVIYNPSIIHPWAHFSTEATYGTIAFFEEALGAPNPIAPSNQIWQWKVAFNTLGLIGIVIFLVNFVTLMVFTPLFASLRAREVVEPQPIERGGIFWLFVTLSIGAIFGTLTYLPILRATDAFRHTTETFRQTQTFGIGMWALACAGFGLILMFGYYLLIGRNKGVNLHQNGVIISVPNLGKTILLAVISVTMFFGVVFFADYFFMTDFRIWVVAIRPFGPDLLRLGLFPYMLFFVLFFVVNSISLNSFNYGTIGGKKWTNTLIVIIFNVLPAVVLLVMQYGTFMTTGFLLFGDHASAAQAPYHMFVVWLFPFLVLLTVTPLISRQIYKVTNNPYLPGIINGIIITMMAVANTLTWG